MHISAKRVWVFLKQSYTRFSDARAAGRGAAISFYTVTAIVPVLVVVLAVAGFMVGRDIAGEALFAQFDALLGETGTEVFRRAVIEASRPAVSTMATLGSLIALSATTSGVFLELQEALDAIWGADPEADLAALAKARLISIGLVIALGFVLLVSLVIDTAIGQMNGWLTTNLAFAEGVMLAFSQVFSLVLLTGIFAGIMKYLPKPVVPWRAAIPGAIFTAVLFIAGKLLIGLYLSTSAMVTALGQAGAFLALLFWVYYSAQIFLFGAACTWVLADGHRAAAQKRAR